MPTSCAEILRIDFGDVKNGCLELVNWAILKRMK